MRSLVILGLVAVIIGAFMVICKKIVSVPELSSAKKVKSPLVDCRTYDGAETVEKILKALRIKSSWPMGTVSVWRKHLTTFVIDDWLIMTDDTRQAFVGFQRISQKSKPPRSTEPIWSEVDLPSRDFQIERCAWVLKGIGLDDCPFQQIRPYHTYELPIRAVATYAGNENIGGLCIVYDFTNDQVSSIEVYSR